MNPDPCPRCAELEKELAAALDRAAKLNRVRMTAVCLLSALEAQRATPCKIADDLVALFTRKTEEATAASADPPEAVEAPAKEATP